MNRRKLEIPSNHSIQTNTTTTVRWNTGRSEDINVLLDTRASWVDTLAPQSCLQLIWQVQTLATRQDLLTSHHEIIRIRDLWVLWIWVGVEWTSAHWELVKHVEVSVELLAHQSTEGLLLWRRHILIILDVAELLWPLLTQKLLGLGEGEDNLLASLWEQEWLGWVDGADKLDLLLHVLLQAGKDVQQDALEHVHNLMVVLLDFHLQIETSELGHVAWSVGVLSSVDWTNTEDTLAASSNLNLLVELWGLGEVGGLAKVWEGEDVGASLGCGTDQSWRLELFEAAGAEVLDEEELDLITDVLNGAVDWGALADDWVVEEGAEVGDWNSVLLLLLERETCK